jgi:hypothetical protein
MGNLVVSVMGRGDALPDRGSGRDGGKRIEELGPGSNGVRAERPLTEMSVLATNS